MAAVQGVRTVKAFVFIQREVFFSRRFDLLLQFIGLGLNIIFIGIFAKLITINANISQYGTPNYLDYLLIGSIVHNLVSLPRGSISSFVLGRVFPVLLQLSGLTNFHFHWNQRLANSVELRIDISHNTCVHPVFRFENSL